MSRKNVAYLLAKTQADVGCYFEVGTVLSLTVVPPGAPAYRLMQSQISQLRPLYAKMKMDVARAEAVLRTWSLKPPVAPRVPADYPLWTGRVTQGARITLADAPIATTYYLLGYTLGDAAVGLQVLDTVLTLAAQLPTESRLDINRKGLLHSLLRIQSQLRTLGDNPAFSSGAQTEISRAVQTIDFVFVPTRGHFAETPSPNFPANVYAIQEEIRARIALLEKELEIETQ